MRGEGVSEDATGSYRWHSFLEKVQRWLESLRTCWERFVTGGQKLAVSIGTWISQSSLNHLQHSDRKEVKVEKDKMSTACVSKQGD